MKTNYYIGVPVKNDEKRCYFLCSDDCFITEYFLEIIEKSTLFGMICLQKKKKTSIGLLFVS